MTLIANNADAVQLFRRAPDAHIDVGAGQVAYRRVGEGPDALFVHGWPVSGATFRNLLPYLTPQVTCHLVDLVGTGQSRFDRDTPIGIDRHIDAVTRVVDALGLERFAVVGHDSGGMIARHALAGDRRLCGMALIDTEQPQGLNWRFRQFLLMSRLPGFEHLLAWAAMQRGLRKNPFLLGDAFADRSLLDGDFEAFFLAPLRDDEDRRWAAGELIRSFETSYVEALADLHPSFDIPVRLVWGEDDPFFPVEWAREMVDSFPHAELVVVPGGKLFVHEERPEEVAAALLPALVA